jgi:hypothetical protein
MFVFEHDALLFKFTGDLPTGNWFDCKKVVLPFLLTRAYLVLTETRIECLSATILLRPGKTLKQYCRIDIGVYPIPAVSSGRLDSSRYAAIP